MAYAVHWQINFVALHSNDAYRVDILEDGYSEDVVHLRGAANPFETTEDNSDDAFTPIRKQTGSLRIADNGYDMDGNAFNYTELLPSDTFDYQVKLWKIGTTNTLRWIGYIRPDSLTSKMFEKVSIREFKLTCPLGTLYEVPVTFSNNKNNYGTVKTIGQILYTALNSLHVSWSTLHKQNNVSNIADLKSMVSLLNFISKNEPTHTTPSAGDIDAFTATWTDDSTSWGAVLEEICKFWGWTLYSRALHLYIVTRKQVDQYIRMNFSQLQYASPTTYTDTPSTVYFENMSYASTNHTECRRLGYKDITVESNVNEKKVVFDPDFNKLEMSYWPVAQDPNQIIHISNNYLYMLRRLGAQNAQQNNQMQFIDNYQIYENRILATSSLIAPFIVCRYDSWDKDAFKTASAFSMKNGICCYAIITPTQTPQTLTYFAKTIEDICVPLNSVICIKGSVSISYNPDPDFPSCGESNMFDSSANTAPPCVKAKHSESEDEYWKPVMEKTDNNVTVHRTIPVALKIGDLWWDNDNKVWTSTAKTFNLSINKDGSFVNPTNTYQGVGSNPSGVLFDDHNGSDGFCIYVDSASNSGHGLSGRLKLIVYDQYITYQQASQVSMLNNGVIDNLTVSIYNTDSKLDPQNKATHEYKGIASNKFRNKLNVSLKLASGNKNVYGLGQLFNSDYSLLDTLSFINYGGQTSSMQPEQRLLERMTEFYRDVSTQNIVEIMDDSVAEKPSSIIVKEDGEQFHTQSVTHDWRNGTMKLTLINN